MPRFIPDTRSQSYKANFGINYIKNRLSKLNSTLNYINFDVIYAKKVLKDWLQKAGLAVDSGDLKSGLQWGLESQNTFKFWSATLLERVNIKKFLKWILKTFLYYLYWFHSVLRLKKAMCIIG